MNKTKGIFLLLSIIIVMLLISLYVGFSYKEGAGPTPTSVPKPPAPAPPAPAAPKPPAPAPPAPPAPAPPAAPKPPAPPAPAAGETCSKTYSDNNAKKNAGQPTTYKCQSANKPVNCSNSQFKDNLTKIKNDYKNDKCFQTFLDKLPTSKGDFKNPTECDCDGINIPNTKCTTKSMGDANICVKK